MRYETRYMWQCCPAQILSVINYARFVKWEILCSDQKWMYNRKYQHQDLFSISRLARYYPDSKVHGANKGPIWGRQDPGGPHVCPMNFAIWVGYGKNAYPISCISWVLAQPEYTVPDFCLSTGIWHLCQVWISLIINFWTLFVIYHFN